MNTILSLLCLSQATFAEGLVQFSGIGAGTFHYKDRFGFQANALSLQVGIFKAEGLQYTTLPYQNGETYESWSFLRFGGGIPLSWGESSDHVWFAVPYYFADWLNSDEELRHDVGIEIGRFPLSLRLYGNFPHDIRNEHQVRYGASLFIAGGNNVRIEDAVGNFVSSLTALLFRDHLYASLFNVGIDENQEPTFALLTIQRFIRFELLHYSAYSGLGAARLGLGWPMGTDTLFLNPYIIASPELEDLDATLGGGIDFGLGFSGLSGRIAYDTDFYDWQQGRWSLSLCLGGMFFQ